MAKTNTSEKIKINRIKVILVEKDISQKQFAEMIGRSTNTVSSICNNETQPSLRLLLEISKILDVDIRELLIATK